MTADNNDQEDTHINNITLYFPQFNLQKEQS